ncbi:MAG: hypothetical protein WCW03_01440 [Candidatus Paceibacterota bacterium]|jgi:predicted PurR-regulated permease PerM
MDPNTQIPPNTGGINNIDISSQNMTSPEGDNHKKVGSTIAILVVVFVLIIAALYIFASQLWTSNNVENTDINTNTAMNTDTIRTITKESVQPVTNTDVDVQSLEEDLNTAVDGLDAQNF